MNSRSKVEEPHPLLPDIKSKQMIIVILLWEPINAYSFSGCADPEEEGGDDEMMDEGVRSLDEA